MKTDSSFQIAILTFSTESRSIFSAQSLQEFSNERIFSNVMQVCTTYVWIDVDSLLHIKFNCFNSLPESYLITYARTHLTLLNIHNRTKARMFIRTYRY